MVRVLATRRTSGLNVSVLLLYTSVARPMLLIVLLVSSASTSALVSDASLIRVYETHRRWSVVFWRIMPVSRGVAVLSRRFSANLSPINVSLALINSKKRAAISLPGLVRERSMSVRVLLRARQRNSRLYPFVLREMLFSPRWERTVLCLSAL